VSFFFFFLKLKSGRKKKVRKKEGRGGEREKKRLLVFHIVQFRVQKKRRDRRGEGMGNEEEVREWGRKGNWKEERGENKEGERGSCTTLSILFQFLISHTRHFFTHKKVGRIVGDRKVERERKKERRGNRKEERKILMTFILSGRLIVMSAIPSINYY
jgi:hypothetical protein